MSAVTKRVSLKKMIKNKRKMSIKTAAVVGTEVKIALTRNCLG